MSYDRLIFSFVYFLILTTANCTTEQFRKCLEKDSISCLQMQFFKDFRELLSQESIELVSGVSLVRDAESRSGKNLDLLEMEETVENATDVISRQEAIENFLARKTREIVVERTIQWDVNQTIRNILNSIPQVIKAKFTNYVTEARGKGKKLVRFLLPLLIGLKLKMFGIGALTYLVTAVLTKKALLASLISLMISGYIGLKKLLAPKQQAYSDIAPYHPVPSWGPVYDAHSDVSEGQKLAYSSHMAL